MSQTGQGALASAAAFFFSPGAMKRKAEETWRDIVVGKAARLDGTNMGLLVVTGGCAGVTREQRESFWSAKSAISAGLESREPSCPSRKPACG